jgi:hypothetical protein
MLIEYYTDNQYYHGKLPDVKRGKIQNNSWEIILEFILNLLIKGIALF